MVRFFGRRIRHAFQRRYSQRQLRPDNRRALRVESQTNGEYRGTLRSMVRSLIESRHSELEVPSAHPDARGKLARPATSRIVEVDLSSAALPKQTLPTWDQPSS